MKAVYTSVAGFSLFYFGSFFIKPLEGLGGVIVAHYHSSAAGPSRSTVLQPPHAWLRTAAPSIPVQSQALEQKQGAFYATQKYVKNT